MQTHALRIDYVRIVYRGTVEHLNRWADLMTSCLPDRVKVLPEVMKKHCRFFTIYDPVMKRPSKGFEIWGIEADTFFACLPPTHYLTITRIDVRSDVPEPPKDIEKLTHEVMNYSNNNRRTVGYKKSPPRTKQEGRDAGGKSLTVGSHESERRLALYKRGKENWALEVQFGKKRPYEMIAGALESHQRANDGKTAYNYVLHELYQAFYDAIPDMTGHTYEEYAHLDWWQNQEDAFTGQESLLSDLEDRFKALDPEAREAFVVSVINPEGYTVSPVVRSDDGIERIPVAYSDDELDDMALMEALNPPEDEDQTDGWAL